MALTQTGRLIAVTTPLGKDVLCLEAFQGQEAISSLFRFTLFMLSTNPSLSFGGIVGKSATVEINTPGGTGPKRYINGLVSQFSQGSSEGGVNRYHATLVPWLWALTRKANCRIFQNKAVPDIIKQIFSDLGFKDFRLALTGSYQPREYCVQYRETDFDFVSRLMEEEGIFYFFEHAADKHTMVLGDVPSVHKPCPGQASFTYAPVGGTHETDNVSTWLREEEVRPGKYALQDYNFETPANDLKVTRPTTATVGKNDKLEIYDYPGEYLKTPEGERLVKLRMEEQEALHTLITGTGDARAMTSGYLFDLTKHFRGDANGSYLLVSVGHQGASNLRDEGGGASYSNTFTCMPKAIPFRPARLTPRPFVHGCQTAVVVGVKDSEIDTDKYGRVKVQFFWDREGKKDQNSSCWIRVATPWAGKKWGMIHIPRIGQEVIVDFLEGDPDKPLIVGSVYNAEQMPPYALPDNKTQSGLKTRSALKGTEENFNELRFEDKKGKEDVYFHAEKDFHRVVEHDDDLKVGHDQTIEIKNDRTETVKEGNETITIEKGNRTETVKKGNEKVTVEKGDRMIHVQTGKDTLQVKDNRTVIVEQGNDSHTVKMGNKEVIIEMGNDSLQIKMGNQTTKLALGKSETEAMQSIELKVGQSSLKVDQTGITIKGMMITIEGQVQTQIKGLMTQVNGDAMLMVKGGVTMIN